MSLNSLELLGVKIPHWIGFLLNFGIDKQVVMLVRLCNFPNSCINFRTKLFSNPVTPEMQSNTIRTLALINKFLSKSVLFTHLFYLISSDSCILKLDGFDHVPSSAAILFGFPRVQGFRMATWTISGER